VRPVPGSGPGSLRSKRRSARSGEPYSRIAVPGAVYAVHTSRAAPPVIPPASPEHEIPAREGASRSITQMARNRARTARKPGREDERSSPAALPAKSPDGRPARLHCQRARLSLRPSATRLRARRGLPGAPRAGPPCQARNGSRSPRGQAGADGRGAWPERPLARSFPASWVPALYAREAPGGAARCASFFPAGHRAPRPGYRRQPAPENAVRQRSFPGRGRQRQPAPPALPPLNYRAPAGKHLAARGARCDGGPAARLRPACREGNRVPGRHQGRPPSRL
jgi:hypothetical protein